MNEQELESILRAAPRPPVPTGLQQRLANQVRLRPGSSNIPSSELESNWIRRWWPTLVLGGSVLACAATLLTQQVQIRRIQSQLATISAVPEETGVASLGSGQVVVATEAPHLLPADEKRAEIVRLRVELADLKAGTARAEGLQAEIKQLEAELAARSGPNQEDLVDLDQARDRAKSIKCVNSMKNIGLALRIWAKDHEGSFPTDLLSLTNELVTPKLLVCPADTTRTEAPDWASFNTGHQSYEFLAPGGSETEPTCVAVRCPIHRHICLSDGSVQMSQGDGSNLTARLVTRNGKLYFESPQ